MKIKIFCHCSLFPSWLDQGLISNPVHEMNLTGVFVPELVAEPEAN